MKTLSPAVLLVLAVVPGCSRDDALKVAQKSAASSASAPGLVTVPAKPETVPAGKRRVLELEGGVRVEVIAEGLGDVVAAGDEVALSLTLSYMPKSPEELKADAAKAEEAAKADADAQDKKKSKSKGKGAQDDSDAKKSDSKTEAESVDEKADAAKSADESAKPLPPVLIETAVTAEIGAKSEPIAKSEGAATPAPDAKSEAVATPAAVAKSQTPAVPDSDAKPEAAVPVEKPATDATAATQVAPDAPTAALTGEITPAGETAPTDAETKPPAEGTAPAPAALPAPLEPVIVVSTKNLGTPIRARVGKSGALLPGLSRALVGLRQGTIAEITMPAEAAYGAAGLPSAGIPPGTALFATIEIREVKR